MLLFVFFFVVALTIFALVLLLVRPTHDQKVVIRRMAAIKAPEEVPSPANQDLQQYLKTLNRGSFGWLEQLVDGSAVQRKIQLLLIQADQTTSVGMVMMTSLGLAGVAGLLSDFLTSNILIALPAALAIGYLPVGRLGLLKSRRLTAFNKALPDCIDMMARSLRAGHSLNAAISIVADQAVEPARTEFKEVFKKQSYGLPMREALMQLLDRVPSQDLRVLVTGMLVQKDTGGNLAEILDRILYVIRERIRIKGEIQTHTAQGRMTGYILCALPIIMLGLINMINPGYSSVLFNDPFGQKMLYVGMVLLAVGGFTIRKIVGGIEV